MNNFTIRIIRILTNEYLILSLVLLAAFIVRLYRISNPVADWHSFRQADTASVTREYEKQGVNLLFPKYHDISTTQSGIFNPSGWRFVEFPIFNLVHIYFVKLFTFLTLEIAGRLVSIVSAVISSYFLFLIGRHILGKEVGLLAAFFYALLPFNIYFTRVILPEPLAITCALASIWFFILYVEKKSYLPYLISAFSFSLALLVKPYMFFYGFPILYICLSKYSIREVIKMKSLYMWILLVISPFVFWRVWMLQFPEGIPFWKWTLNGDGIRFQPAFWRWIFGERLTSLILGYWGLILFAFGLLRAGGKRLFTLSFLAGACVYVLIFATANVRHDYYQTIIVPPIVIVLSLGVIELWSSKSYSRLTSRVLLVISIVIMFVASASQIKEFYKINRPEIIAAGYRTDELVPKTARVIAPYNGDTAFLYQTKRSGWPVVDRPIDEMIQKGAEYFVSVDLSHFQTVEFSKRFKVIDSTSTYVIIDLTKEK